jgi:hypothetical protein
MRQWHIRFTKDKSLRRKHMPCSCALHPPIPRIYRNVLHSSTTRRVITFLHNAHHSFGGLADGINVRTSTPPLHSMRHMPVSGWLRVVTRCQIPLWSRAHPSATELLKPGMSLLTIPSPVAASTHSLHQVVRANILCILAHEVEASHIHQP